MGKGLSAEDIEVGKTYRAKGPRRMKPVLVGDKPINDRTVLWVSPDKDLVQYTGTEVSLKPRFRFLAMRKFLQWASHTVKPGKE